MTDENPSITNHVSIDISDPSVSYAFYDAVLGTIGAKRVHEDGDTVAYGKMFPEFRVGAPLDRGTPITANGVHCDFFASST